MISYTGSHVRTHRVSIRHFDPLYPCGRRRVCLHVHGLAHSAPTRLPTLEVDGRCTVPSYRLGRLPLALYCTPARRVPLRRFFGESSKRLRTSRSWEDAGFLLPRERRKAVLE